MFFGKAARRYARFFLAPHFSGIRRDLSVFPFFPESFYCFPPFLFRQVTPWVCRFRVGLIGLIGLIYRQSGHSLTMKCVASCNQLVELPFVTGARFARNRRLTDS
tara:strand:- start:168 stop:482 length:315 start_codon:yes stop_codon:yes gene_type:complete